MSNLIRFRNRFPYFSNLPVWNDDFFEKDLFSSKELSFPPVNILESIKHYTLEMAVPGKTKSDFKIEIDDNNVMTISLESKSEKKEEESKEVKRMEFNYSSFSRSFSLPSMIDKAHITGAYENGILTINLPKLEESVKTNSVKINIS